MDTAVKAGPTGAEQVAEELIVHRPARVSRRAIIKRGRLALGLLSAMLLPAAAPAAGLQLSADERAWLGDHKEIRVGLMNDWPPFSFLDFDGNPVGISPGFVAAINRRIGGVLKLVPGPWKERYDDVKDRRLDVLLDLTPRPDREPFFNFTKSYLSIPHVIVARKDVPFVADIKALDGKVMALERGFGNVRRVRESHPKITVKEYANTGEALEAVARGEADAYGGNRAVATYLMASEVMVNLKVHGRLDFPGSILAMGVRKDWPVLRGILDKALADIGGAERQEILSKWVRGREPESAAAKRNSAALTPEEQTWVAKKKAITVANTTDWPPFDFAENGEPRGLSIDLIKKVAEKAGLSLNFVNGFTWPQLVDKFKAGEIDVLPGVYETPERLEFMAFTSHYATNPSVIVASAQNSDISGLKDLAGRKAGMIKGFATAESLARRYPEITGIMVESALDGLKAVASGKIEAFIGSYGVVSYILDNNLIPNVRIVGETYLQRPEETHLHMGVLKGQSILRDILQKGLDAIEPNEMRDIRDRWLILASASGQSKIHLIYQEREWLRQHPTIRVGDDFVWPPFSFRDENGAHTGISADILAMLAKQMDVKLEPVFGLSWSQAVERMTAKQIDIMPVVSINDKRREFMLFTKPYLINTNVIATRNGGPFVESLKSLVGTRVGVVKDYSIGTLIKNDHPGIVLVPVASVAEGLKALAAGEFDAFVGSLLVISYEINRGRLDSIKVAAPTEYKREYHIGVRKDWPELVAILDKGLAAIEEKEMAAIKNSYMTVRVEFGWDKRQILLYALPVVGVVAMIFIVIVVSNRKLSHEVEERHRAETKAQERETWFKSLLESAPDATVIVGANGVIKRVNIQAERLFGYPRDEIVGQTVESLLPENLRGHHPAMREAFMRDSATRPMGVGRDLLACDKSGRVFPAEVSLSPIDTAEGHEVVATVRDITERRQAEAALQKNLEELQAFNRLAVDRELRMIELKREINELNAALKRDARYEIVE